MELKISENDSIMLSKSFYKFFFLWESVMRRICIDESWTFRRGYLDSLVMMNADAGEVVNLPHDGMISTKVRSDAPSSVDSGYFVGGMVNYTKFVTIPAEWKDECVGLYFDGAMMNATVDINGCRVATHHYGYTPFYVDLTNYVSFGEENRITINTSTEERPGSRWYTGNGLFRGVNLCHSPRVHVKPDGVFVYTREISDGYAFLEACVDVMNETVSNRLVRVSLSFFKEGSEAGVADATVSRVIQANPRDCETAYIAVNLKDPALWDAESPNLYRVKAVVTDLGEYRTHFEKASEQSVDEDSILFGVRTITADAVHGLRINGKVVKLKGGCLHHDNGLLGAVSLYECELRKVKKLKELGFNAIRTTHNPMSSALIEACDRGGMYVFDEAFDAWNIAKRRGDFSEYFDAHWKEELTSFVVRDRKHPSVIIWSTGNEIPERGGLGNGYKVATELASTVKALDPSRPVSNGICSFWSGLDDYMASGKNGAQNAADDASQNVWEDCTEPFTNGLDIVGYNYMEDLYEKDHEMFPERVILGSENFPKEIGFRWPLVEKLPYVIGEFTWTAWDYIGEAGLGKAVYSEPGDPNAPEHPWDIMPDRTSPYPWRTANDADFDITGRRRPQGDYRSVVFGSEQAHLYTYHPSRFGKVEMTSMWGFPELYKSWNYAGYEGKPVEVVVFTRADEAELFLNGASVGRKAVSFERPYPNSVRFETAYAPGKLEVVCYKSGREVSRDSLETSGPAVSLRLAPEKAALAADGHDCAFIGIDVVDAAGRLVSDASVPLTATVTGPAVLAGFGTGNPVTDELYTDERTMTYEGHATAVLRSGYAPSPVTLRISSDTLGSAEVTLEVKEPNTAARRGQKSLSQTL